ncbi:MAG TPA: hypothetical protein VGP13_00195, partial [Candidatus Paceibacterota bacterium]|nr:hypothetical protein [Candidatus Paceibacterota bacterium]
MKFFIRFTALRLGVALSLGVIVASLLVASLAAPSAALAQSAAPSFDYSSLTASAAIAVDGQTGNIILAKNFADIRAPASLTKLVTALTYLS